MLKMNKYRGCDNAVTLLMLCLVWPGGSGGFGSGGYVHHGVVAATAATRDGASASSAQSTGRSIRRRRTATAAAFDTMLLNASTVDVTNSSSSNAGAVQKPTNSQVWSSLPTFSSKATNTSSTTASNSGENPASNHPHVDFDHRQANSTNKQHETPSGGKGSTSWDWTLLEDGLELMIFAIALLVTFITVMSAQMLWDLCHHDDNDMEEEFDDDALTTCTTVSTCSFSSRHSCDVLEPEPPNK